MGVGNYSPSTISRVSDIALGIPVQTSVLTNTVAMVQNQYELFNVYGRIVLTQLYLEMITAFSNTATTVQFNYTGTTPVLAVKPLTAASAALNAGGAMPVGGRVIWLGGAVATAAGVTVATGLCSDISNVKAAVIGCVGCTMTIGMLTAAANATSGTTQAFLRYYEDYPGSYVTAAV